MKKCACVGDYCEYTHTYIHTHTHTHAHIYTHIHTYTHTVWCWRRMEMISWTDNVRNEVLLRVKEQRNVPHERSKRKANWIGHILRRNCLLQRVIEGKIKGSI